MKRKGFTLIELLIVVAIIAILAAIAVPNFLEAQVRAKISRVKNDMRSLDTALKSYTIDSNVPPPGIASLVFHDVPAPADVWWNVRALQRLTSPIAYMTSLTNDPFSTGLKDWTGRTATGRGFQVYWYETYADASGFGWQMYDDTAKLGYAWSLHSFGPTKNNPGGAGTICYVLQGTPNVFNYVIPSYDATNGTISSGWIVRTDKGIFDSPGN